MVKRALTLTFIEILCQEKNNGRGNDSVKLHALKDGACGALAGQTLKNDEWTGQRALRRSPVLACWQAGRHLSLPNCRNRTAQQVLLQFRELSHPSLWRPAMQGFGEDPTDLTANRELLDR